MSEVTDLTNKRWNDFNEIYNVDILKQDVKSESKELIRTILISASTGLLYNYTNSIISLLLLSFLIIDIRMTITKRRK